MKKEITISLPKDIDVLQSNIIVNAAIVVKAVAGTARMGLTKKQTPSLKMDTTVLSYRKCIFTSYYRANMRYP